MSSDADLYLFDGYNLLHASGDTDRQQLVDRLAGYVALRGARGVVVFDGVGEDAVYGSLEVRFAAHADQVLERLAAERRAHERVHLISSDRAIRGTAGQEVAKRTAKEFMRELAEEPPAPRAGPAGSKVEDVLDTETRARLERWRRNRP